MHLLFSSIYGTTQKLNGQSLLVFNNFFNAKKLRTCANGQDLFDLCKQSVTWWLAGFKEESVQASRCTIDNAAFPAFALQSACRVSTLQRVWHLKSASASQLFANLNTDLFSLAANESRRWSFLHFHYFYFYLILNLSFSVWFFSLIFYLTFVWLFFCPGTQRANPV